METNKLSTELRALPPSFAMCDEPEASAVILAAADRIDSDAAEHEKFLADVLHLRGEIEWLDEECKAMRGALTGLLDRYVALVNCGDCGHWDPEREDVVKHARTALSMPRVVRSGDAARVRELEAENARLKAEVERALMVGIASGMEHVTNELKARTDHGPQGPSPRMTT